MKFWNNYVELCNKIGKSPNAVAKEIGISSGAITFWKKDERRPTPRMLAKISAYFDVSVDYLLGYETPEVKDRAEKARKQMNSLRMMRYVPPRTAKKGHIEPKRTELGQKENAPEYTEGERLLLDLFRQVPEGQQELVLQMIKAALGKM